MNLDLQILVKLTLMLTSIFIAFVVISVVNPVYAVLALILLFFSASVLFIIQGAEFLAFIYLLVYVGALLILFLWVVMTMPVKKNAFLHLRVTIMCLALFMGFVIFIFFCNFATLKVIKITPDFSMYSAFIQYLKQNIHFRFFLRFSSDAPIFLSFCKLTPAVIVKQVHAIPITPSNFLYDIYLIHSSQNFFLLAPILKGSAFFQALEVIYYSSFSGDTLLEICLAPQFFLHSVAALNLRSEFISFIDVLKPETEKFILIAACKPLKTNFNLILPPFVDVFKYTFIKPTTMPEFLANMQKSELENFIQIFSTKIFINPVASNYVNLAGILYQRFAVCLIIVGFILLITMVGAIWLVKFQKLDTKSQELYLQIQRDTKL